MILNRHSILQRIDTQDYSVVLWASQFDVTLKDTFGSKKTYVLPIEKIEERYEEVLLSKEFLSAIDHESQRWGEIDLFMFQGNKSLILAKEQNGFFIRDPYMNQRGKITTLSQYISLLELYYGVEIDLEKIL